LPQQLSPAICDTAAHQFTPAIFEEPAIMNAWVEWLIGGLSWCGVFGFIAAIIAQVIR